jgi:hypothetical protein
MSYNHNLWVRFSNRFVKSGKNPAKVLSSIVIELKSYGFSNPLFILQVAVQILEFPLEIKRRRRGRKFLHIA